jgi:sortase A
MSGRTAVRRIGWVFIGVGVLALAWGFATWTWGDPVTGLYTRWQQHRLAAEYDRLAADFALPPVPAASGTPSDERVEVRRAARRMRSDAHAGQAIGRLRIERLDLDMVLVNGTDSASLRKGPGRDLRTYLPGEDELVYIAGHRTTFGAPFAHIDRLKQGDRVEIEMPYGVFAYRVSRSVIVPADDIERLRSRGREEIALQACHPRFSARERYLVYALPLGREPLVVQR